MSTRLDLALQEVAEAAGASSGFGDPETPGTATTVHRLAARVRRRRAARGAATTAVAASAAGAVALVGPQLTREATPAGDPDADPGECRSAVADLPSGPRDVLGVELGQRDADDVAVIDPAGAGQDLGTWLSGSADLVVNVSQIPDAGVGATRLRFLLTQDGVVLGTAHEPIAVTPLTTDEVLSTRLEGIGAWTTDHLPVYPLEETDRRWWEVVETSGGALRVAQTVELGLTACDGSGALPPGTYQVYATTVDAVGTARGAAGPWDVEVAADDATPHALPDGFPQDVPLIDGRLVAAHRHGDGWAAEIVTPGNDRGTVAVSLLAPVALRSDHVPADAMVLGPPYQDVVVTRAGVELPGWAVRAVASRTPAGEPSVVYILTARP
ncbi:hypothetical protein [Cellulomonas phragmiteti]|uniref:Fibronectin type-III domain-containing protein n=1 Tax=Cellulomonas phragmiteti TaxID=478780 RepID=A0ABQ4DMG5_9CELL|nr:hypothetical protein [Cellulomonas phragmiteti]GIG40532.1 hypothetical protein Cph01nite_22940 [Cellulomonas phragmiteti]